MTPNLDLIQKYLCQKATSEEQALMDAWVKASPENAKVLQEYGAVWDMAAYKSSYQPCMVSAWARIKCKSIDTAPNQIDRPAVWSLALKLAATLFILGFVAALYFLIQPVSDSRGEVQISVNATSNVPTLVSLPDQSKVWLKNGSSIQYDEDFKSRQVLLQGVAYFEVEKTMEGAEAFKVVTDHINVTVLGTKFMVEQNALDTKVVVSEGKVNIGLKNQNSENVGINANQWIEVGGTDDWKVINGLPSNYISWKTGVLKFESVSLKEVSQKLQEHYQVNLQLKNENMSNCLVTANFNNKKLEEVLRTLETILDLKVTKSGQRSYHLAGPGCKPNS